MTTRLGQPPFDPQELTADASLNDVVIGPAQGAPGDVAGRPARDVCSRNALLGMAQAAGLIDLDPARLSDQLAASALSSKIAEGRASRGVLEAFGARLGALVVTLRDPATPAQQGSNPGRRAYLDHWLTVQRVWLAGGLLRGTAGDVIACGVRAVAALAERPCPVAVIADPEVAALIGAARFATVADGTVVVADLGHTSIRTALADIRERTVVRLRDVASTPAPIGEGDLDEEVGRAVRRALTFAARRAAAGNPGEVEVAVSVASYLRHGQPVDDGRSIYGGLGATTDAMTAALAAAAGRDATIRFVHDGTAAAAASGDTASSAVVSAGSWLGIGFTPPPSYTLELSTGFRARAAVPLDR